MPDNLKRRRPQDSRRINVHQAHEVRDWAKILGISAKELRCIVKEVGDDVEVVRRRIRLKNMVRNLISR